MEVHRGQKACLNEMLVSVILNKLGLWPSVLMVISLITMRSPDLV
jgi:hypothetical protein